MNIAREYQFTRTIGIWMTAMQAPPSISGSGMEYLRNLRLRPRHLYALAPWALAFTMLSSHVDIGSAARLLSVAQAQPSVYFLVIGVEYMDYFAIRARRLC